MGKLERIAAQQDRKAGLTTSRRGFLLTAVGSAFMFGFAREGKAAQVFPASAGMPGNGAFEPTIWCSIAPDGVVNINVIRAEMGQHVGTALARIIADEMEADWDKVKITQVDTDPKWGLMVTGGSWSVWMTWDTFRQAGAAARTVMIEEGAKLLGTSAANCVARNGRVIAGGKSISFGEIVSRAHPTRTYTPDEMAKLPLKPRRWISRQKLMVRPFTASTPSLMAWCMHAPKCRPHAMAPKLFPLMIAKPKKSKAICATLCLMIHLTRCLAGWLCWHHPTPQQSVRLTCLR
jgi:CO/xanthine dehydrogenase Mo-binding subunit